MNRCPDNSELVLYAAGELPAGRRLIALDAHLASCETCRREAETLSRGLAAMETLQRDEPLRPEAAETLRLRLRAQAAHTRARRPAVLVLWHYRWAAAAAVLVAAAVALTLVHESSDTVRPPADNQAAAPAADQWAPDAAMQEEITEIAAGIELLETGDGGNFSEAEPAPTDGDGGASSKDMNLLMELRQADGDA